MIIPLTVKIELFYLMVYNFKPNLKINILLDNTLEITFHLTTASYLWCNHNHLFIDDMKLENSISYHSTSN